MKQKTNYFFMVYGCAFILTFLPISLKAQGRIVYEYDHAGNRISRSYVITKMNASQKAQTENRNDNTDLSANYQVTIYPNPTRHTLQVDIEGVTTENQISFVLINSEGVTLQTIKGIPERLPAQIDMSSYITGWYFLDVNIDGKSQQFKIIKQ